MKLEIGKTYVNGMGAVIVIDGLYLGQRPNTLGDIYTATADPGKIFGNVPYLVTTKSMEECGYGLVDESKPSDE